MSHSDLTADTGGPLASGDPFGYVTGSDGVARVVYRGEDARVHELWLRPGEPWRHSDLTADTGGPRSN